MVSRQYGKYLTLSSYDWLFVQPPRLREFSYRRGVGRTGLEGEYLVHWPRGNQRESLYVDNNSESLHPTSSSPKPSGQAHAQQEKETTAPMEPACDSGCPPVPA